MERVGVSVFLTTLLFLLIDAYGLKPGCKSDQYSPFLLQETRMMRMRKTRSWVEDRNEGPMRMMRTMR